MKKLVLVLLVNGLALLAATAAIPVGTSGSGIITFPTRPPAADWSSKSISGADVTAGTIADLINAVQTNVTAASVTAQLVDGAGAAQPGANANALWTSASGGYVVTRPTGNGATVVMATLTNTSGSSLSSLVVMYTLSRLAIVRTEQVVAHEVFYSMDGSLGSWQNIAALSGGPTTVSSVLKSNTVTLASAWAPDTVMYFLWVDDNATGGTDDAWSIDDVSFAPPGVTTPLSVVLNSPTNGQYFSHSVLNPSSVTVAATAVGTVSASSVTFYTNGVAAVVDASPPFGGTVTGLTPGNYTLYAKATNASEVAYSATNTITVRDEFVHYTGGVLAENFDSITSSGTITPIGWYVGTNHFSTNGYPYLAVGDGGNGPSSAILGWNYGTTGDADRALGTAPTGTDRAMVVRIQNNTSSNITSFQFSYDGEVWRNYTNSQFGLTNEVSTDGITWTQTGFNFYQPIAAVPGTVGAINGNDPANRSNVVATVTGVNVAPGGVIYISWVDINEGGTDGGLAVDNFTFEATGFSQAITFVTITSPANGASFSGGCSGVASITANASASINITNVNFILDGSTTLGDSSVPYSVVFPTVANGNHQIEAVGQDNSGGTVRATNTFTVVANQAPAVSVTNTFGLAADQASVITNTTFLAGTAVTNQIRLADSDGTLTNVAFFVNGTNTFNSALTTAATNCQYVMNDLLAGTNVLTIRALDNCGVATFTSLEVIGTNPPNVALLVTNGSLWRFSSTGAQPTNDGSGRVWNHPLYDDSGWTNGMAELGGGDAVALPTTNPERTLVDIGPTGNRNRAAYFRHAFVVNDPAQLSGLTVRVLNDDGTAVYINGTLVATFHMTNDVGVPITYNDLAGPGAIGDDGTFYYSSNITTAALVPGVNVIAVELHQDSITSSDLSFDLMLWGQGGGSSGPRMTVTRPDDTHITIAWGADATGYTLYGGPTVPFAIGTWQPIGGAITGAGSTTVLSSTGMKFFILRNP